MIIELGVIAATVLTSGVYIWVNGRKVKNLKQEYEENTTRVISYYKDLGSRVEKGYQEEIQGLREGFRKSIDILKEEHQKELKEVSVTLFDRLDYILELEAKIELLDRDEEKQRIQEEITMLTLAAVVERLENLGIETSITLIEEEGLPEVAEDSKPVKKAAKKPAKKAAKKSSKKAPAKKKVDPSPAVLPSLF